MPPLESLYQEFKNEGLVVVGVESWSRRGPMRLKLYEQEYGITFPLLYGGPPHGYAAAWSPTIALHNRQGRLIATQRGDCDWSSASVKTLIRELLAESR